MSEQFKQLDCFWYKEDENGITNLEKTKNAKVIRRVASTDKSMSFEEAKEHIDTEYPTGMVVEDGKLIGLGIHIFNEDVYPLQSFEIYLRGCDLTGDLNLSDFTDMVFVDVYNNRISSVNVKNMPSRRILGLQNNQIENLNPEDLIACQGIDVGKNCLKSMDVSNNKELVELYVNDNQLAEINLSNNSKLKYFYCHNNNIKMLDTRNNPLLRHLDASGNPMDKILSLAPQCEEKKPLELYAQEGGHVGLKYYPVYNAQWKETGEWRQSYHAYPKQGYRFTGWQDETGNIVSQEAEWIDEYGTSRILSANFEKEA